MEVVDTKDAPLPDPQIIVRVVNKFVPGETTTSSFHIRDAPLTVEAQEAAKQSPTKESSDEGWIRYTADGNRFLTITPTSVEIFDVDQPSTPATTLAASNVSDAYWSPKGTFVVTYSKPNLVIWEAHEAKAIRQLNLKDKKDESWPVISWTADEGLMWHLTSNQIVAYSGNDCTTKQGTLHQKGVMSFSLAPSADPYRIATFTPGKNTEPARVSLYAFPNLETPTASKSFFHADTCQMNWNSLSTAILLKARVEVDTTGENYGGKSLLYFLSTDGALSCTVPFGTNKGEVHDAQWAPDGKDFIAVQGDQPAKSLLFNGQKCVAVRDFGNGSHNKVIWSPHGRFVCIAGFGNLAGEMTFWDKPAFKLIGRCQDMNGARTFEWTPDSRHFITSVLFPKRRVENGFTVWTYAGEKVFREQIERLSQVEIRPRPGVYPNRPMSPRLADRKLLQENLAKTEAKPKAYIPPALRAAGGQGVVSALLKREEVAPKKIAAPELDDPAAKAKKKEKEKARLEKKRKEKADAEAEQIKKAAEEAEEKKARELAAKAEELTTEEGISRKLKATKKKLAQSTKLLETSKTRPLDDAEQAKVQSIPALEGEIAALEKSLQQLTVQLHT